MRSGALILTWHAVEDGPAPLCIDPGLFRAQLDCIADSGATALTVGGLAAGLRDGELPERAVAISFDDGFASVIREAVPLLLERELPATVFCVAGHLGGVNDWPTDPPGIPRMPLAAADELAASGLEIGSHGMTHTPLHRMGAEQARREVVESKQRLEVAMGSRVESLAYPYGAAPGPEAAGLVNEIYSAACVGGNARVQPDADPMRLPRVDAHYLRRPETLRRVLAGELDSYLALRRAGARARRLVRKDYAPVS